MIKPLTEGKTKHEQKRFDTPKPDVKPHGQRPTQNVFEVIVKAAIIKRGKEEIKKEWSQVTKLVLDDE